MAPRSSSRPLSRPRRSPRVLARPAIRQPQNDSSSASELDESHLRVRALESRVQRLSERLADQASSTSGSSSGEQEAPSSEFELPTQIDSTESEYATAEEDSPASPELPVARRQTQRKKKAQRDSREAMLQKPRWAHKAHGAQFQLNRKVLLKLHKALESEGLGRDTKRLLKESASLLSERNKTLWLADEHGWEVALAFNAGGGLQLSKEEQKRLDGLLASSETRNRQPARPPVPFFQQARYPQAQPTRTRGDVQCFRCKQSGHIQRFCPFPLGSRRQTPGQGTITAGN